LVEPEGKLHAVGAGGEVKAFVAEGDPLVVGIDETLERRWGKKISAN
jgi:ribosome-associated protein YbcJ (S4-like RNA binding protein)